MAEVDFEQFESGPAPRGAGMAQLMNIAGATCSIALVVGLAVWGYKLAVRDVNGVPVIRAMVGPMREAPQKPGGDVASHQGLSVNAVAAVGTASALSEQVLLAPAPVELAPEDAPGLGADGVEVGTSAVSPVALPVAEDLPVDLGTDAAVALALADALTAGVEPFAELASAEPAAPTAALRPRPRPSQTAAAAPAVAPAALSGVTEIDPATLAVGTQLVQLGAFDTDADARAEWGKLQAQFGALLGGKAIVVQAAASGGSTFYRLRAHGFAGEDDARQLCAALVAAGTPCIPALHR